MSAMTRPRHSPPTIEAAKTRTVSHIPSSRKGRVRYWTKSCIGPTARAAARARRPLPEHLGGHGQRRVHPVLLQERLLRAVVLQRLDGVLHGGQQLLVALLDRYADPDIGAEGESLLELVRAGLHYLVD